MSYTVNTLRNMTRSCEMMRDRVKAVVFKPDERKVLDITFGPTAAAELVGRTPEALAKAEKEGRLAPPKQLNNGRRYYTLEDLTHIRKALNIHPGKLAHENAVVVAVQNFKGGVGKSTITVNRRSIGTPYRRAKGTPLALHRSIDVGRGFRAAGGVGRA